MTRQTNDMTAGVVTGEAVELDIRLARWPSRLLGQFIDLAVQFLLFGILAALVGKVFAHADSDAAAAVEVVLLVVVFFGYPTVLETFWRGRTLGKAALGLRVVRDDGGPERFRQALFRALMFVLVDWWGPGLIVSVLNGSSKRVGDLVAGTIVIQDRISGGSVHPVAMPAQLAWWATNLDLQRLDDDLALSCRQFLARESQMHQRAREALGSQLVAAVASRVWPPPPPGTPGWAYLSAVLAERRRRATVAAAPQWQQPPPPPAPTGWQSPPPPSGWQQPQPAVPPAGWQQQPPPNPSAPITAPGPFAPPL
jgi:uncharacterized RDD family membrane protein YckC